jgi:hypothetical protein
MPYRTAGPIGLCSGTETPHTDSSIAPGAEGTVTIWKEETPHAGDHVKIGFGCLKTAT